MPECTRLGAAGLFLASVAAVVLSGLLPAAARGGGAAGVAAQEKNRKPDPPQTETVPVAPPGADPVEFARKRGIEYLASQQQKDGSWESPNHKVGITALCTIALLENGVPADDSLVRKGYEYVQKNSGSLTNTYELALSIVLLSRYGDRRDRPRVRTLAGRLVAGQLKSGGWHYTCPLVDSDALEKRSKAGLKEGPGDNSCTQFAVLGLWVASRNGVGVDDVLADVVERFEKNQEMDGGWDYNLSDKAGSSPSMTTAGLFCLAVGEAAKLRRQARRGEAEGQSSTLHQHPVFENGLKRTSEFAKGIGPGSSRYYLWSVERVGVLLGLEKFDAVDWFKQGSEALIKTQAADGSWPEGLGGPLAGTSFAILFLRKANLGSDISRLLEGEKPQKFAIVSRPDAPRFDTLEEALGKMQPGETLRIDGDGPFEVKHLEFNQDVTLQAGFGFLPVLNYTLGTNRLGIRLRPESDEAARHALIVRKGNVTLEGIHVRMDPPTGKPDVKFSAIGVYGGSLRLLNCMITEGNRAGSAGVSWMTPGTLIVRNSLLAGGRAGVEIVASGKQELVVDGSALYSQTGVLVRPGETKQPADVSITLFRSAVQCKEAFAFPDLPGKVSVTAERTAFACEALGLTFLTSGNSKKDRSYQGSRNIYDVQSWIGARGSRVGDVKDLKSWASFWDGNDKDSYAQRVPFAVVRQQGAYSHQLTAADWALELSDTTLLVNARAGLSSFTAGPGTNYDQYRDTFDYRAWTEGKIDRGTLHAAAE